MEIPPTYLEKHYLIQIQILEFPIVRHLNITQLYLHPKYIILNENYFGSETISFKIILTE